MVLVLVRKVEEGFDVFVVLVLEEVKTHKCYVLIGPTTVER